MADTVAYTQQLHKAPLPPSEPAAAAVMPESGEGASGTASLDLHWPTLSSLLLSQPGAAAELYPYPTFAELDAEAASDDEDEDDHWLDVALSSTPVRFFDLPPRAALADATAALSALRAAHQSEVERQQLSSALWQAVKQHTRQHFIDSHSLPIQLRRPPSAANIATLTVEESQQIDHHRTATTRTRCYPSTAILSHTLAHVHVAGLLFLRCGVAVAVAVILRRSSQPLHLPLSASTASLSFISLSHCLTS